LLETTIPEAKKLKKEKILIFIQLFGLVKRECIDGSRPLARKWEVGNFR
jgi:hypothetical protein